MHRQLGGRSPMGRQRCGPSATTTSADGASRLQLLAKPGRHFAQIIANLRDEHGIGADRHARPAAPASRRALPGLR